MWCTSRPNIGPKAFQICINDVFSTSDLLSFVLFADDTNIFYSHQDINILLSTNNELQNLILGLQLANYHKIQIKYILYFYSI